MNFSIGKKYCNKRRYKTVEINPFLKMEVAKEWIKSVEGEKGQIRDKYIYPILQDWLKECNTGKLLDLGCGQGVASQFCKGFVYFGIDPSLTLINRAKEVYGLCGTFFLGNIYDIPFEDEYFDAIFSINVWFHLENIEKASKELGRVLKKGGMFLIITACPDSYDLWMQTFHEPKIEGKKIEGENCLPLTIQLRNTHYCHTHEEIISNLKDAFLNVLCFKSFAPCEEDERFKNSFKSRNFFQYYKGVKNKEAKKIRKINENIILKEGNHDQSSHRSTTNSGIN